MFRNLSIPPTVCQRVGDEFAEILELALAHGIVGVRDVTAEAVGGGDL